jgi:hypothetical protein
MAELTKLSTARSEREKITAPQTFSDSNGLAAQIIEVVTSKLESSIRHEEKLWLREFTASA